jgi:hypothetical protein
MKALDPENKFRRHKVFKYTTFREFCSLLGSTMMGAKTFGLAKELINEQTLPGILGQMSLRLEAMGQREFYVSILSVAQGVF